MEYTQPDSMIGWWKKVVFDNYANFKGRARRSEFWYFQLVEILIGIFFSVLVYIFFSLGMTLMSDIVDIVNSLVSLALLIPALAVAVRRLHDIGKSGWNILLIFIPLVGLIVLIVWFCTEGVRGENFYGPDPKAEILTFEFENAAPGSLPENKA